MNIVMKMKQDWDRRAKHHARFWIATEDYQNETVFAESGAVTAKAILSTLGLHHRNTWTALDIGCGIGRVLKPLAPHFYKLIGVDVSAEMISKSKSWLRDVPNVTTVESSGVDLSLFPPRYFNVVYSYVAFQHMPRPVFDLYLEEINRVLKPQGFLVFQIPIGRHLDAPLEDTIAIRFYEYRDLVEKLSRTGFRLGSPQHQPSISLHTTKQHVAQHEFLLAQKVNTIRPDINVGWVQAECHDQTSWIDTQMYLSFAEDCLLRGNQEEAMRTYESLLEHNPSSLEAWLQLATVLIDSGKIDQAISKLTDLTQAYPNYPEGHRTLQNLIRQRGKTTGTSSLKT